MKELRRIQGSGERGMTNKDLKKLSREELLKLLLIQNKSREDSSEGFTVEELEEELHRERYKKQYGKTLRGTIYMLVTVAAAAVLIATLLIPVLQIYGDSMNPTLQAGDIVISVKSGNFQPGDMVAFYYNNKILVKRVIASAGEWVDIDADGNVSVNGQQLEETYIGEKALGECDIELPYQVPESRIFVMGDNRGVSIDSRNTAVGCVAEEQIVGKIIMRLWPFKLWGHIRERG